MVTKSGLRVFFLFFSQLAAESSHDDVVEDADLYGLEIINKNFLCFIFVFANLYLMEAASLH